MAGKIAFTDERVRKLKPPAKGRAHFCDTRQPALELIVTYTGNKSWYLNRWHDGRAVRVHIGKFPALNVAGARDAVAAKIAEQVDGVDIQAERRARRAVPTIGELFAYWLEYAKARKKSWRQDKIQYESYIRPQWENRRLDSISKADVAAWHAKLGTENGNYAANRAAALLRAAFNKADAIGYVGPNPASKVEKFPESPRERVLSAEEAAAFDAALETEEPKWRDFFRVLLYVSQRRGNVQRMRWAQVDIQNAVWHIPAAEMKAGKPIDVALSAPVLEILARRKEEAEPGEVYVFPGHRHGQPISDPMLPWKRVCEAAGLVGLRPHDLRRTGATVAVAAGVSLFTVSKMLAHQSTTTTEKSYAHRQLDPIRAAANTVADILTAAINAKKKPSGKPKKRGKK